MDSIWVIEEANKGTQYWHFYSAEDDLSEPEEVAERLKAICSYVHDYRAVQYVRDVSTVIDRPWTPEDGHSPARDCASMDAMKGNHCQHYHQGGKCCDCGLVYCLPA